MSVQLKLATLGGGCFWCLEPVFSRVRGVERVVVGYAGGRTHNPTYAAVCTGATGHAEVVQISFDPQVITFTDLLHIFFAIHDPTTLNRQGADSGTQYRSIILTENDTQREAARDVIVELEQAQIWPRPIVTQVEPLTVFYPAEDYHQQYFEKNPYAGYCQVVIHPKLEKFEEKYAALLKPA